MYTLLHGYNVVKNFKTNPRCYRKTTGSLVRQQKQPQFSAKPRDAGALGISEKGKVLSIKTPGQ